jgi:methylated-DNA-[protein]-cysteine S-methyltransferase
MADEELFTYVPSPIGALLLTGVQSVGGLVLTRLHFTSGKKARGASSAWRERKAAFAEAREQLEQYFAGERKAFDIELAPRSTEFQGRVLDALAKIPYGEVRSYAEVAQAIGSPKSVRAVGTANGNNPIAIIIPCHRVIGSDGSLTGFGGGLEAKRYLLDLEQRHSGLFA